MSLILRRNILLSQGGVTPPTPPLPYDSVVEYIASSGTEVINTGIPVSSMRRYYTYAQMNVSTGAKAEGSTSTNEYFFIGQNAQKKFYAALGNKVQATTITNDGDWHTMILDLTANKFSVDGVETAVTASSVNSSTNFSLFACNGVNKTEGNYSYYIKGKKGRTIIYGENDIVLADMVPVRVGQVGYMYDSISRTLMGDANGGSFTVGQDI